MRPGLRKLLDTAVNARKRAGGGPVMPAEAPPSATVSSATPTAGPSGFPDGRYFTILGELPENYRGTATVALHRSCLIAEQTGRPLEILTLGHTVDYEALTRQMQSDGRLTELVRFRNMWNDLAVMHPYDRRRTPPTFPAFAPLDQATTSKTLKGPGVPLRRFRQDAEGKNLQIDMCRADGSIIVSERRDCTPTSARGTTSFILCDTRSRPVVELASLQDLRRYWLDRVVGDEQAFIFSDTFGVAGLMHTYRRPNVVVVQTFHNHHLAKGTVGTLGLTEKRYLPFLDNLDEFDATVLLTERQRDDLDVLMGPSPTRWVVPNSRDVDGSTDAEASGRDPDAVMSIGSLIAAKQVDHAIRAVHAANQQLPQPLSLQVFGEGTHRPALESLIRDLDATTVTLAGHVPGAARHFATASCSLLLSRSEAMPLVLIESMARGCIPIAYDVRYGPREIITDGVDGFLVEPGDVDAVTRILVRLRTMDEDQLAAMRARTIARAQEFSDAAIGPRWAELLRTTLATKVAPRPLTLSAVVPEVDVSPEELAVTIRFRTDRPLQEPRVHLVISGRATMVRMRRPAEILESTDGQLLVRATVRREDLEWVTKGIIDAYLEVHDRAGRARKRLAAPTDIVEGAKTPFAGFEVYATVHGSLSLKKLPAPTPDRP